MAFVGKWSEVVYVRFTADVDKDMGWVTSNYFPFNGYVANFFVNRAGVGIEVDENNQIPV